MAVETPPPIKDFASMAIASMTTDPEAAPPAPLKPEVKADVIPVEKKQESGIPEGLFAKEKKVEDKKPDQTLDSEIDAISEPNFRDPKNKDGWDTLKSKAKDLAAKYDDAQKKLIELEAKGKDTDAIKAKMEQMEKDFAATKAKADEYEGIVKKRWIEDDPEFRKNYVDGRKELIARAQKIVRDSGLDQTQIETALNLSGEARIRALASIAEGLDNFQSARLGRVIDELDAKDEQASKLRNDPGDFLQQRETQEKERRAKEADDFKQTMSKAFRDAAQSAPDKFVMARKLDGADWWNKQVDESTSNAEKFWQTNTDPKAAAEQVLKAHLYDAAEQGFIDMRTERDTIKEDRDKLKAELEKLYGRGSPQVGNGGNSGNGKGGKPPDFADRVIDTAQIRK